jgi:hypothetical protein
MNQNIPESGDPAPRDGLSLITNFFGYALCGFPGYFEISDDRIHCFSVCEKSGATLLAVFKNGIDAIKPVPWRDPPVLHSGFASDRMVSRR